MLAAMATIALIQSAKKHTAIPLPDDASHCYVHPLYIYIFFFFPWHLLYFLSCLDTLIVWCIYIYIDVQALIIK